MVEKLKFIWMDGKLVNWDNANVHVLTHSLHYGLGAFEGIRSYETVDSKSAIFRLQDHIRRLFDSAHIVQIKIPFSINALINACKETVKANDIKESYIRPIAYIGEGAIGVNPKDNPIGVSIIVTKMGKYLGKEAMEKGAKVKISSFTRYFVNSAMTRAKLTGNYMTSVLAKREVVSLGFDEALMLDTDGFIAEGTGENIFIVKNGILKTTPFTSILPGITRSTVIQVAKDFGYDYSIISADSIQFIKDTENLTSAIKYLSENTNIGLVGFNLNDRQAWEGYIDLIPNLYFKIKQLNLQQDDCFLFEGLRFYPCEVIRNFFLAKTECLINNKWDENLKLGEHEDYFYRLKQTQWTVNYCPDISANYINEKPEEYLKYRQRMYSEFRTMLQKKYNISGWIHYEK